MKKSKRGMTKKWWLLVLAILIVSVVGIYLMSRPLVEKEVTEITKGKGLEYTLVEKTADACWVVVGVEVKQIPSEDLLKETAFEVWKREKTSSVFIFLPGMSTTSVAYAVAKFTPRGGLLEFKIPSASGS